MALHRAWSSGNAGILRHHRAGRPRSTGTSAETDEAPSDAVTDDGESEASDPKAKQEEDDSAAAPEGGGLSAYA